MTDVSAALLLWHLSNFLAVVKPNTPWKLDVSDVKVGTMKTFGFHCSGLRIFAWSDDKDLSSQWRHNERDGVSNHQCLDGLLNCLFGCRSKKLSKLRVTGLCEGNSPVTGEFSSQKASNVENVSIWWRHHVRCRITHLPLQNLLRRNGKHKIKVLKWKQFLLRTWIFNIACKISVIVLRPVG